MRWKMRGNCHFVVNFTRTSYKDKIRLIFFLYFREKEEREEEVNVSFSSSRIYFVNVLCWLCWSVRTLERGFAGHVIMNNSVGLVDLSVSVKWFPVWLRNGIQETCGKMTCIRCNTSLIVTKGNYKTIPENCIHVNLFFLAFWPFSHTKIMIITG